MMQSQPLRSASLCQRYLSSAPSTWSTTQPQSRSDHVPGKTTTPNLISPLGEGQPGSPRNRRFRGVVSTRLLTVAFDVEAVVLDHVIGEQLAAHRVDALARLALAARFQPHFDVLAHAHVGHLAEAERRQALAHGDALRVVDDGLWGDDDFRDHLSLRAFCGNRGLPTSF